MRKLIALAVAVVIVAIAVWMKSTLISGRVESREVATPTTLSPHEIHLNYKAMKELPVREVKEPF
jgi:hypothetical protein